MQRRIEHAEAKARELDAKASAAKAEEPNGPDVQARYCLQYAAMMRQTLDSLKRSENLRLPETALQKARRELLEKHGIKPPTEAEREQRATKAWTGSKTFTAAEIKQKPLTFRCCGQLQSIEKLRGIA
jgi:hypothetical protein